MTKRNVCRRIGEIVKLYYKPFLFLFAIYLLGMITLLRDHYTFVDDLYRSIYGGAWNDDFGRFSSSFLSYFLNQSFSLFDISPVPQIIAMGVMACVSLMLVRLFTGETVNLKKHFWPLLITSMVGISPLVMNAWMYKFDAPCMALGIIASVLPYAVIWNKGFVENITDPIKFSIGLFVTMICVLVMWSSFQAASGIFLVLGLAMVARDLINKNKCSALQIVTFAISYVVVSVLFYFAIKDGNYYREIATFGLTEMFGGIWNNICLIAGVVVDSMKIIWWVLVAILVLGLSGLAFMQKDGHKRVLLSYLFLVLSLPVSFGAYLALQSFPIYGRSFIGLCFGFVLFLLLLGGDVFAKKVAIKGKNIIYAAVVLLVYSSLTFAWSFGNALNDQYRYDEFLSGMIAGDLGEIYKTREEIDDVVFIIKGEGGLSAVMAHHLESFPVAKYVFFGAQTGVNRDPLGYYRVFDYHNYPADWHTAILDGYHDEEDSSAEVLTDTYYYQIKRVDETSLGKKMIIIDLKEQAQPLHYDKDKVFFDQF